MARLWRRAGALALAVLATLLVAACGSDDDEGGGGGDAKKGGSITIAQTSQPDSLDPALAYTTNSLEALWAVYIPPVTYKRAEGRPGTELIPGVAQALPKVSADGKTYTFRIRKGLTYWNGKPVKASDWEHSIKRVLNLESGGASYYSVIDGADQYVKARKPEGDISGIETNDGTGEVTIRLTARDGTFLNVLGMTFSAVVPGNTPFENLTKDPPPGVGPYEITKSVPNREFVMKRVKSFDIPGIPKAGIDMITTKIVSSTQRQTQDVISGKLDYMQDPPPPDLLPDVRSKYGDRYKENITISTYFFFMNGDTKPFNKEQVRDAVNYAIDSTELARLFGGRLEPGCNFLPPNTHGFEKIDPCPYGDPGEPGDLQKARSLIEQAGEKGTEVTVWTNNDDPRPEIGQYYADQLNKIGLKANLRVIDGGVYFQTIGNAKTKAQTGYDNFFQDFPHPGNFLFQVDSASIQPTNNQNHSNVRDAKLDAEIAKVNAGAATDPKVLEAAAAADRIVVEKSYVTPYGSEKLSTFMSERMDFENCSRFHPLFLNDYSSWCLK